MGTSTHPSRTRRAVIAISAAALVLAASLAPAIASDHSQELTSGRAVNDRAAFSPNDPVFGGMASDGTKAFFTTPDRLVATDTDTAPDVYERSGGTTTLVSAGAVNGNGSFPAWFEGASSDGTRVFFVTHEPLVAGDTDTSDDIYQRSGGTTTLVSAGAVNGNGAFDANPTGASSDGTRVFFFTAERLVAADTDTWVDTYERSGGTTKLVSAGAVNGNGAFHAFFAGASSDGTTVFFRTMERLVAADTDYEWDVYQRSGGTTTLVSAGAVNGNGAFEAVFVGASSDGTKVFFQTDEPLVATDTDSAQDVYQRSGGTTTLVTAGSVHGNGPFDAYFVRVSGDGTKVFLTTAERLVAADIDTFQDIYQRSGDTTTLISAGAQSGGGVYTYLGGISNDGTKVYFTTDDRLVASDTDNVGDVYLRSGDTTTRVSVGTMNGNRNVFAWFRGASSNGTSVFFETKEPLVAADTDINRDVYERSGGTTTLVSTGAVNGNGAFRASFEAASSDGTRVFFTTREALVAADTNGRLDIYERSAGTTKLVSRGP